MSRPDIPADIRRAVLVEAGHRCAIPRCNQTELDVHHIVPWADCQKHEYSNLIALCPICHRRAHLGDIDRKSLFIYKQNLAKEFGRHDNGSFQAEAVEIKRRLKAVNVNSPESKFQFDFPDFPNPVERIVSRNIEAWGLELLAQFQEGQTRWDDNLEEMPEHFHNWSARLSGDYEITRRDERLISIRYTVDAYYPGAAHGGRATRVLNYTLSPFRPVTLEYLLGDLIRLPALADLVRERLRDTGQYTDCWLNSGTEPTEDHFSLFIILQHGVLFIFPEYRIASFAEGEQSIYIDFRELNEICNAEALESISTLDDDYNF